MPGGSPRVSATLTSVDSDEPLPASAGTVLRQKVRIAAATARPAGPPPGRARRSAN